MSAFEIQRESGKIFCPLTNSWQVETPEEKVRQSYVKKLFEDYGYTFEQMAQEVKVTNLKHEQKQAFADIVIWKSKEDKEEGKNAFIVVKCKAENVRIYEEDYYQGYNYALWAGASFFVTTNEKETKYFNVDKEFLPKKLVEVVAIPTAQEANDNKRIKDLLNKSKLFTREEFTKTLRACHNIIRNNDKLSPEAAFDEISKILFMKIKYERDVKGEKVFSKAQFLKENLRHEKEYRPILKGTPKDLSYMQWIFENTKQFYSEEQIFESSEIIKIRQNSFEQILEKLESYNLSDTQDDVKGIAFEQFLGTTFRGELGQFFTPRTIVDFMTTILDPQEGELICDPTCGSGGFLIKAFEYVKEKIEKDIKNAKEALREQIQKKNYETLSKDEQIKINRKIEDMQTILNKELDIGQNYDSEKGIPASRLYDLSHNSIFGTDANSRMARTSKMNMIMHGDGHGGVHHHDGLLNINGIFEERFDVILTNPPFGSRIDKNQKISEADRSTDTKMITKYKERYGKVYEEALRQVEDNIGKSVLSLFDVGKMSGLTEVLFMERCLRLLKKGGRMGMVLPEGILNTSSLQRVREYFEGKAKIIFICSIPQDVFVAAGASVKPSLVFLKRFTEEEEENYKQITLEVQENIRMNYKKEINLLNEELESLLIRKANKKRQKEVNSRLKEIEDEIVKEAKPIIKNYFDYEIPVAEVQDAGITSTGVKTGNKELKQLQEEFREYNMEAALWEKMNTTVSYKIDETGKIIRISSGREVSLSW